METASVLSDEDYDVISNPGQRSLESSLADLPVREIPPALPARTAFPAAALDPADIQAAVRAAVDSGRPTYPLDHRTYRVYLDGVFDVLTTPYMLQLRQAKLAFPSVHLMVGVFSDESCHAHGTQPRAPHVERCELLRHCRWVDEIVPDAVWTLSDAFIVAKRIDYVALEEGSSVNPEFDKLRLKGYDHLKKLGRVIPTKRTLGLAPVLPSAVATPSHKSPGLHPEDPEDSIIHGISRVALADS